MSKTIVDRTIIALLAHTFLLVSEIISAMGMAVLIQIDGSFIR
jgi:hypothetical protein